MSGAPTVDILLATWNGERYLAQQIDSILAQTYPHWRLVIRDDGSTDRTLDIVRRYISENPDRMALMEDREPGLGACGNFARLMGHADADYVMFSDQDDVWLPHKTERLLEAIRRLEEQHGQEIPLLVHSDLKVVGADLGEWHPSFMKYQALDSRFGRSLNRLLIQNVVTGCASLCNKRLIELARPVPEAARMHDWWLALVAAALGKIGFVDEPTVLYRQHDSNTLGAKQYNWPMVLRLAIMSPLGVVTRTRDILRATRRQAAALLAAHGADMDGPSRHLVESYVELSNQGFMARRMTLLRYGFLGSRLFHKLAFLVLV